MRQNLITIELTEKELNYILELIMNEIPSWSDTSKYAKDLNQLLATLDPDPTPYCSGCRCMSSKDCKCGPIAEND